MGHRTRMIDEERRDTPGICSLHRHSRTHTHTHTSFDICNSHFTTDLAWFTISWLSATLYFISPVKGRNYGWFYPRNTLILHTTPNLLPAGVIHLVVLLKFVFSLCILHSTGHFLWRDYIMNDIWYPFVMFFFCLINRNEWCCVLGVCILCVCVDFSTVKTNPVALL